MNTVAVSHEYGKFRALTDIGCAMRRQECDVCVSATRLHGMHSRMTRRQAARLHRMHDCLCAARRQECDKRRDCIARMADHAPCDVNNATV